MNLREARVKFTSMLPRLIDKAVELGYEIALDEGMNHTGIGHMAGSLHYLGLAVDLLLYKDGQYLSGHTNYIELGEYWKSIDPLNHWGGDFPTVDADHFSFAPPELVYNRA